MFLCLQLTRPHAVKTVKYINPSGGTWTVAAQRIPAKNKDDIEADAVSCCFSIWMLVLCAPDRICHAPSSPAHHELQTSVSLPCLLALAHTLLVGQHCSTSSAFVLPCVHFPAAFLLISVCVQCCGSCCALSNCPIIQISMHLSRPCCSCMRTRGEKNIFS